MMPSQNNSPPAPNNAAESLGVSILKSLPGGAIAGGIVSWWLGRRKERSDSVSAIRDLRANLIAEVHCYWTREKRNDEMEIAITRMNMKFSTKIKEHACKYGVRGSLASFYRDRTLFNAELTAAPFGTKEWARDTQRSILADQQSSKLMEYI